MNNSLDTPVNSLHKRQSKDRNLTLEFIVKQIEKGTELTVTEVKDQYSDALFFALALRCVTTTKKARCTALNIPVEAGCRYKREFEREGNLIPSIDKFSFTKQPVHFISTNPQEFERLQITNTNQLNLFEQWNQR